MDRDYVGDALKTKRDGETPEDLILRALEMLNDDERSTRMSGHASEMRGEMGPEPMAEEMAEGEEAMPPECAAGECEHPEHQREDMLPEDF